MKSLSFVEQTPSEYLGCFVVLFLIIENVDIFYVMWNKN